MCRHLMSREIIAHRVLFRLKAVFLMTYSCCVRPSIRAWLPSMTTASLLVAARKTKVIRDFGGGTTEGRT